MNSSTRNTGTLGDILTADKMQEKPMVNHSHNLVKQDLKPKGFPQALDWKPQEQERSLKEMYGYVVAHSEICISWYYHSKQNKSFWGVWLRFISILLVALAGLVPILSDLIPRQFSEATDLRISPAWSAVILAFAALLNGIDRFLGLSSGWVRYVRTAQALTARQHQFQFDWEELRRSHQRQAERDQVGASIDLCRRFLIDVQTLVQRETDLWAQEFERTLRVFDRSDSDQLLRPRDGSGGLQVITDTTSTPKASPSLGDDAAQAS